VPKPGGNIEARGKQSFISKKRASPVKNSRGGKPADAQKNKHKGRKTGKFSATGQCAGRWDRKPEDASCWRKGKGSVLWIVKKPGRKKRACANRVRHLDAFGGKLIFPKIGKQRGRMPTRLQPKRGGGPRSRKTLKTGAVEIMSWQKRKKEGHNKTKRGICTSGSCVSAGGAPRKRVNL